LTQEIVLQGGNLDPMLHVFAPEFFDSHIMCTGSFASVSAMKVVPKLWDPFAHLSDGCIDIIIVPQLSRADALGIGSSFAAGRLFKDDRVAFVKATRFSIETMGGHIPINIDGEFVQV
jgi:diacylglycerol kinase family enzyme